MHKRSTSSDHDGVILGTYDRATASHNGVSVGNGRKRQGGEKQNKTHELSSVNSRCLPGLTQDAKRVKRSRAACYAEPDSSGDQRIAAVWRESAA